MASRRYLHKLFYKGLGKRANYDCVNKSFQIYFGVDEFRLKQALLFKKSIVHRKRSALDNQISQNNSSDFLFVLEALSLRMAGANYSAPSSLSPHMMILKIHIRDVRKDSLPGIQIH